MCGESVWNSIQSSRVLISVSSLTPFFSKCYFFVVVRCSRRGSRANEKKGKMRAAAMNGTRDAVQFELIR